MFDYFKPRRRIARKLKKLAHYAEKHRYYLAIRELQKLIEVFEKPEVDDPLTAKQIKKRLKKGIGPKNCHFDEIVTLMKPEEK